MRWFLQVFPVLLLMLICDVKCTVFNYEAMNNFKFKNRYYHNSTDDFEWKNRRNDEAMDNPGFQNRRNYAAKNDVRPKSRRDMGNFRAIAGNGYAYPEPLPSSPRSQLAAIPQPYQSQYQGLKIRGDVRVYNKQFDYTPKEEGQVVTIRGDLNCKITHLSAESNGAVPIILRGGVGHFHFSVIVRAKPGDRLTGSVKAYCRRESTDN